MLAAATDGSPTLGPALVTAGGLVIVALVGLAGTLVSLSRRGTAGDTEQLVSGLAGALSDERDARLAAEAARDELRTQLDACIERERIRRRR